jgi:hypothetical protein
MCLRVCICRVVLLQKDDRDDVQYVLPLVAYLQLATPHGGAGGRVWAQQDTQWSRNESFFSEQTIVLSFYPLARLAPTSILDHQQLH